MILRKYVRPLYLLDRSHSVAKDHYRRYQTRAPNILSAYDLPGKLNLTLYQERLRELNTVVLVDDPTCRFCEMKEEGAEHICWRRLFYMGHNFSKMEMIWQTPI